jgi:flagellar protein FlaF
MYQFSYAEVVEESGEDSRAREGQALERSVELLRRAEESGSGTRESIEALLYCTRLWTMLIEDLGQPDNDLPVELRAGLISIGLWVIKEAERVRLGESSNFRGMIEIISIVREGLR